MEIPPVLGMVRFSSMLVAVLLAWILCVCVHEFAHALVAYIGGDKSVRAKGYLALDPTKFIHPVFSLLIPAFVLLMGGIPLAGGAVYIDERALKNRKWQIYVSAAGPASNFLLYLLFGLVIHPMVGLVDPLATQQPAWVYFCGAMAVLNLLSTLINLIPCPPLDGYRMIEHQFPEELQWKLRQPQNAYTPLIVLFAILWFGGAKVWIPFWFTFDYVSDMFGMPVKLMGDGYNLILFGSA